MTEARPLAVATNAAASHDHYLTSMIVPAVRGAGGPARSSYQRSLLGGWEAAGARHIRLTALEEADVAVLPFTLEAVDEHPRLWAVATRAAAEAERAGKVLLVFCHGDRYIPAPGARCVMFRTALDAAAAGPLDVALPAWVTDPDEVVPVRPRFYRRRPNVGFTGHAHPLGTAAGAAGWARFAVRCAATAAGVEDLIGIPPASAARVLALAAIRASRHVEASIRLRPAMTRLDLDLSGDALMHRELLQDITSNDYGLAVRGMGNYSYRLYEVLAAGRVPLLVDTGAVLPRASVVAWDRLTVRVPLRHIATAGRRLAEHHAAQDAESWTALQHDCRTAWLQHLSAAGFLQHVVDTVTRMVAVAGSDGLRPELLAANLR